METLFKIVFFVLVLLSCIYNILKCIGYKWAYKSAIAYKNRLEELYYKRLFYKSVIVSVVMVLSTVILHFILWF